MIDLGLARIAALLGHLGNPQHAFKALHVAGTNGKGSAVAYLAAILAAHRVRTGRLTSPHLISEDDAIQIDNAPVSRAAYLAARRAVEAVDAAHAVGATEFETQTAAAFELFRRARVQVAVVEVGLGGLNDATNVLAAGDVLAAAITKIALDHQGFLGTTLAEIAAHKAGIIKAGVPCIVDGSNAPEVLAVVRSAAARAGAPPPIEQAGLPPAVAALLRPGDLLPGAFQVQNAGVAARAAAAAFPDLPPATIAQGLRSTVWPGRLETRRLGGVQVLVDGAHNESAAEALAAHVAATLRGADGRGAVRWVVAFSKPPAEILARLVRAGDAVTATAFGAVEGMPWIHPHNPAQVAAAAAELGAEAAAVPDPRDIVFDARPTVVCGSLYLLKEFVGREEGEGAGAGSA